jgi:SNF2 family DNA or RNA helicase
MKVQFALEASKQPAAAARAAAGWTRVSENEEVESIVRASGKMLLLHKLLPKLRAEGRQCLIFSQFKVGQVKSSWFGGC